MTQSQFVEIGGMFADAMGEQNRLPMHAVMRIAAMTAGEKVVFVDGDFDGLEQVTGNAIVLSETRVISVHMESSRRETHEHANAESTVEIAAWSRSDLRRVSFPEGPSSGRNTDVGWDGKQAGAWPANAVIELHYEGHDDPIRLPMRPYTSPEQSARLGTCVPELMGDLGSR